MICILIVLKTNICMFVRHVFQSEKSSLSQQYLNLLSAYPSKSGMDAAQNWTKRGWNRQPGLQRLLGLMYPSYGSCTCPESENRQGNHCGPLHTLNLCKPFPSFRKEHCESEQTKTKFFPHAFTHSWTANPAIWYPNTLSIRYPKCLISKQYSVHCSVTDTACTRCRYHQARNLFKNLAIGHTHVFIALQ